MSNTDSNKLLPTKNQSPKMFDRIAGTYDLLNKVLSFGIDRSWRNRVALEILKDHKTNSENIQLLDLATGTADLAIACAKKFQKNQQSYEILATDPSVNMLEIGSQKINKLKLNNYIKTQFEDACQLTLKDNSFNKVTMSFGIRNVPNVEKAINEIYRVLKFNGSVYILEFGMPKKPFSWPYKAYFRHFLPWIGALISQDKTAYRYLNRTVEDFPYGDKFNQILAQQNFKNIRAVPLMFGVAYLYIAKK